MKTIIYLLSFIAVVGSSCNAQTKKQKQNETTVVTHKESSGNPSVDIKVNKRYDEKGNLVAFDSTYSSYYSSRKGDKVLMDSLFREFKPAFNKQFPLMNDMRFNNLFFDDSLLYNDFFHEDFFKKRFELNEEYMRRMMLQMDSVKNKFFKMKSKQ